MSTYITIDGGTTNTRINLVVNGCCVFTKKIPLGAGSFGGDREKYRAEIKKGLDFVLSENPKEAGNIKAIIASGMITSEYGLCELAHLKCPVCLDELHKGMKRCVFEDISNIPFYFIPGVKSVSHNLWECDIMRGEETELMGIINSDFSGCMYVLPGSHSKLIKTDEKGRIVSFSTMLTGEMTATLSEHTILRDAVDLSVSVFDGNYLIKGYDFAREHGINKALFKVRILKNVFKCTSEEIYSFFLGVVLCDEIVSIIQDECENVVLAGKAQLKKAMAHILNNKSNKNITVLDDSDVDKSTSLGAVRIFENKF